VLTRKQFGLTCGEATLARPDPNAVEGSRSPIGFDRPEPLLFQTWAGRAVRVSSMARATREQRAHRAFAPLYVPMSDALTAVIESLETKTSFDVGSIAASQLCSLKPGGPSREPSRR
jgi:hypothetical protein